MNNFKKKSIKRGKRTIGKEKRVMKRKRGDLPENKGNTKEALQDEESQSYWHSTNTGSYLTYCLDCGGGS